jgi:predicted SAM-dependent methyltransferase
MPAPRYRLIRMSGLNDKITRRIPPSTYLMLHQIRVELTAAYYAPLHRRRAASLPTLGLKLELGSGEIRQQGWTHIDLFGRTADLRLDLRRPLPFATGSVDEIHTEHFFEHLEFSEGLTLLSECDRVLRPGGLISIGVPDPRDALAAYVRGDDDFFNDDARTGHDPENGWKRPDWVRTPMQHLNFIFHQHGDHRFIYDVDTLSRALSDVGFVEALERPFDPKRDSATRQGGTFYVDAVKPKADPPGES